MTVSLAWVTPYSALSDVSAFSRNLIAEWARVAGTLDVAVTVFVNEHGPTFWCPVPIVALDGTGRDREMLSGFDLVVFNIGNNSENHGHINRLAIEVPGVVVVHDLVMQHYFAYQAFHVMARKEAYARLIAEYYGTTGLDVVGLSQVCAASLPAIYSPWDTMHVARMPLIEPFVQSAAAIVVHSAVAEAAVRPLADLPLLRLALPWDQKGDVPEAAVAAWSARNGPLCQFAAFGHISRNKSLHLMIEAFAASETLRAGARLAIAGYSGDRGYAAELREQVARAGLERVVTFAYDASDAALRDIKQDADCFLNLRWPNTESASGSLVEQMNTGKPVVVFPTGSYAEVPPESAFRVSREDGVPALVAALEAVMRDPAMRVRVGASGRALVRRLGAREYVAGLWAFLLAHRTLLRDRASHGVGRRGVPAAVDADWLAGVARSRRTTAGLPHDAVDVAPFRDWAPARLLRWIAVGLFGQPLGSNCERALRGLLHRQGRAGLYRTVADAYLLWRWQRIPSAEFTARPPHEPMLHFPAYVLLAAIDPRVFARACYMGLLRRVPQDVEVEGYSRRLADEPLSRLAGEFVRSEEFRSRAADAAALLAFAGAAALVLPPGFAFPPLSLDNRIDVSSRDPECRRYLLAGWHNVEEGGVWSRGSVASIVLRVPDALSERLSLQVIARFAAPAATPRVLRVSLDGGAVARHCSASDAWFTLDIPLPRKHEVEAGCVLELDSGPAVNLRAAGIAPDPRDLGIRLKGFIVVRRDVVARATAPVPAAEPVATAGEAAA